MDESVLVIETFGVQRSPLESELEEEIFINLTGTKFSPWESSGVGVQEEKKLNDRSPLESVESEESCFLCSIGIQICFISFVETFLHHLNWRYLSDTHPNYALQFLHCITLYAVFIGPAIAMHYSTIPLLSTKIVQRKAFQFYPARPP